MIKKVLFIILFCAMYSITYGQSSSYVMFEKEITGIDTWKNMQ